MGAQGPAPVAKPTDRKVILVKTCAEIDINVERACAQNALTRLVRCHRCGARPGGHRALALLAWPDSHATILSVVGYMAHHNHQMLA